ncbi:unnamed protein product, partial [Iphiclides podalirius]
MRARLVLNGLTAELGSVGAAPPASPEPYHELELYRQLLALPRRARTPDPAPPQRDEPQRRCRTPAPPAPTAPRAHGGPRTPRGPRTAPPAATQRAHRPARAQPSDSTALVARNALVTCTFRGSRAPCTVAKPSLR